MVEIDDDTPFENYIDEEGYINLIMEPSTIGEALEDYLIKLAVIPEYAKLDKVIMPISTDENGLIPVSVTLKEDNNKKLN